MPTEMRSRTTSRGATTSSAQPVRRRYSASTLRAWAASTAAHPVSWARIEQDLAGMGVRRPRLVVEVVAVVPDRHQPEVLHGRERGGAGADDDPHGPARDREERAVALGRSGLGGEHDVAALAEPRRSGPRPAGRGRGGRARRRARRGRRSAVATTASARISAQSSPGSDRPDRARRLPGGEPVEQRRAVRGSARPGPRVDLGVDRRRRLGVLLLDGRVPRRDGEPEHVGAGAGVPRGHGAGERGDVGGEHPLGADHPTQRLQPAGVLGRGGRARSRTRRRPARRSAP